MLDALLQATLLAMTFLLLVYPAVLTLVSGTPNTSSMSKFLVDKLSHAHLPEQLMTLRIFQPYTSATRLGDNVDPIDISTLSDDQKAALLAELIAAPVAPAAPVPQNTVQSKVTLDDLGNDPTLIASLTPEQAGALYAEAENTATALAGSLFQQLHAASVDATQGTAGQN